MEADPCTGKGGLTYHSGEEKHPLSCRVRAGGEVVLEFRLDGHLGEGVLLDMARCRKAGVSKLVCDVIMPGARHRLIEGEDTSAPNNKVSAGSRQTGQLKESQSATYTHRQPLTLARSTLA